LKKEGKETKEGNVGGGFGIFESFILIGSRLTRLKGRHFEGLSLSPLSNISLFLLLLFIIWEKKKKRKQVGGEIFSTTI